MIKLGILVSNEFNSALNVLMKSTKLSGSGLIKVMRVVKKIGEEQKNFNEARQYYLDMYCEKDEAGKPVHPEPGHLHIPQENVELLNKEITELLTTECDIPLLDFKLVEKVELTVEQMLALEPILTNIPEE